MLSIYYFNRAILDSLISTQDEDFGTYSAKNALYIYIVLLISFSNFISLLRFI